MQQLRVKFAQNTVCKPHDDADIASKLCFFAVPLRTWIHVGDFDHLFVK
jgi:hypothetical protein